MFVAQHLGVTLFESAQYLFLAQMAGSVGRIALSTLSDWFARRRHWVVYTSAGMVLVMLTLIDLMPATMPSWAWAVASCTLGFFSFGWYGPWVVWLSETSAADQVGEVIAVAMAINQIAIAATPVVFGLLLDAASTFWLPWLCHAALIAAALMWMLWRRTRPGRALSPL